MLVIAAVLSATPLCAQSAGRRATTRATGGSLAERLRRLLDEPPFDHALWGVAIADPSGRIVFERNGDKLFTPASNTKIIVSAVAALVLPADFRIRTSVYAAGAVTDSVLRGNLVLYGRGDPTLSERYYPSRLAAFELLADSIRARGIRRVEGDLVGDASYFDSVTIHPSWESYDLSWWYAAPVSALAFNDNTVDFRTTPNAVGQAPFIALEPELGAVTFTNRARTVPVDSPRTIDFIRTPGTNDVRAVGDVAADARPWVESISVLDGARWAAIAFRRALESRGITVSGATLSTYDSTAWRSARLSAPIAEIQSPPLPDLIEPILRVSHNWYAEMLLKTIARLRTGTGSWDSGIAFERSVLVDSLRVDSAQLGLADASGLSHWNLVTPRTFVQILRAMRDHRRAEPFVEALPVSGGTGTLRNRYRGRLAGRVRAKTGSIANTNTLSGYLEGRNGTWTFSIQLNNHTALNREALRRIDAIVAELER